MDVKDLIIDIADKYSDGDDINYSQTDLFVSEVENIFNENEIEYKIEQEKISEILDEEISVVAISWIDEYGLQMLIYKSNRQGNCQA